ncbi:phage tail protein I [Bacillus sp. FJAT-26390]|uniref:phage tail protein I n=1 Tax=Bacillus sp. FJAT-26390 TaxID=1743142 RepID=UPI000807F957|nr:phage tail protein I [Bacillus sp. FJAT-26390]OBZ08040.1 phage tail protein I [Bacillus sp. FJAT-26390]
MINMDAINLVDLMPYNIAVDPVVSAAAQAIDGELRVLTNQIKHLSYFNRLDTITEAETDELAWQYHIDFYDPTLPLEQRRELVKRSYGWHRRKGTPSAVEELIATIFGSGEVQEWYEYGGEPGYFKVLTSDPAANASKAAEFIAAINSVKNVRSWLESIEITSGDSMGIYIGNALHTGEFITAKQVT